MPRSGLCQAPGQGAELRGDVNSRDETRQLYNFLVEKLFHNFVTLADRRTLMTAAGWRGQNSGDVSVTFLVTRCVLCHDIYQLISTDIY